MKTFLNIIAVLFILMGSIWFLQGINVLPGSIMSGQMQWVINGTIAVIVGIGLIVWNKRRR